MADNQSKSPRSRSVEPRTPRPSDETIAGNGLQALSPSRPPPIPQELTPSISSRSMERIVSRASGGDPRTLNTIPASDNQPPPSQWKPKLTGLWVQFPGYEGPIWGWFRENAGSYLDAFFASDGEVRHMAKSVLFGYMYGSSSISPDMEHPNAIALHHLLHRSARDALTKFNMIRESGILSFHPVTTTYE